MPVLNKFMCCCQLSTGAVIIGWVGLALDIISLAANFAVLADLNSAYLSSASWIRVPVAVMLACTAISSLANILLLWGTNARNRLFLLPWLTVTMLIIVCTFVTILVMGIIVGDSGAAIGIFILGFIETGIILYMWICILSLFQELREGGDSIITLAPSAGFGLPQYSDVLRP